jgi:hypothetical protein
MSLSRFNASLELTLIDNFWPSGPDENCTSTVSPALHADEIAYESSLVHPNMKSTGCKAQSNRV